MMQVIDHAWIPLRDGRRLSARMFVPDGAGPFPALIEYSPYRCHDITRERDNVTHGQFALRGYVSIRVDIMGTGDSDGLLIDEYQDAEIDDLEEVIDYVGRQAWCTGAVGVFGHSWGAYCALLVAMRQPPHLKAIIPVMGSDDRYEECIHYNGGCLLASNLVWASFMQVYAALPPDPEVVGEGWLASWKRRLEAQPLWAYQWLDQNRHSEYWRQGSVAPDYERISCPVYVFAGTEDRYRDTGFRLVENCQSFVKLTMGPWTHCYPHEAAQDAIDFPSEAIRWWDRWLKSIDTGVDVEPPITTWMPDRGGKGFWLVDREMAQAAAPVRLALQEDGSATMASASLFGDSDWVLSPASGRDKLPITGLYQAFWTAPQDRQIDIFGKSAITFVPRTDITGRQMIVRLFESQTSGDLTEIARGSARFEAFPGAQDQAERRIELHTIARQLPAGTRLCVIVSGSLWPAIPPASAADLGDFDLGHISLELPARKEKLQPARPFAAMEKRVRSNQIVLFPPRRSVTSAIIPSTGVRTLRIGGNAGIFDDFVRVRLPDTGMEMQHEVETVHTLDERLGASTSTVTHDFELSRNGWSIGLAGEFSLTTSQAHHELSGRIQARVDGQDIYQKTWQSRTIALGG